MENLQISFEFTKLRNIMQTKRRIRGRPILYPLKEKEKQSEKLTKNYKIFSNLQGKYLNSWNFFKKVHKLRKF